jgi:hypothetical protein
VESEKRIIALDKQLHPIRESIDQLLDAYQFDEVGELPGFAVHERAEDRIGEDCGVYLFGKGTFIPFAIHQVLHAYTEVPVAQADDLLFYIDDTNEVVHMGIALGPNTARSKFGLAHVYDHPIKTVPTYYGNIIKIFRDGRDLTQRIQEFPIIRKEKAVYPATGITELKW